MTTNNEERRDPFVRLYDPNADQSDSDRDRSLEESIVFYHNHNEEQRSSRRRDRLAEIDETGRLFCRHVLRSLPEVVQYLSRLSGFSKSEIQLCMSPKILSCLTSHPEIVIVRQLHNGLLEKVLQDYLIENLSATKFGYQIVRGREMRYPCKLYQWVISDLDSLAGEIGISAVKLYQVGAALALTESDYRFGVLQKVVENDAKAEIGFFNSVLEARRAVLEKLRSQVGD